MPKRGDSMGDIGITKVHVILKNVQQSETQENSEEAIVFTL